MPGETNPKPPPALQDLDPETRKHIDDAAYKRRIEDLVRQAEQAREKQLLPIRYQHAYHRLQRDLLRLIQAHSSVPKEDIIDALTDASAELT